MGNADDSSKRSLIDRITRWATDKWTYCTVGVWRNTADRPIVHLTKIINLSVRGFLNADLQSQACAMTYRTLLAMVPALAMLFAIARGFGFQNLMESEILSFFPAQHTALQASFRFVDSYLAQTSEGVFVGVGVVVLLWTLISLLGNVEDSFNHIWNLSGSRSMFRKMTDYLAILLTLPVFMICSASLSLLVSSTLQQLIDVDFLKPTVNWLLDLGSYIFTCLFFLVSYLFIPNTKVKFKPAAIVSLFVGAAFQLLQWVFVSGQMYVSKYNAIYGSFSFLPLLLIWLQLVWLVTFIGALLCYASQNAGQFNFYQDVDDISIAYRRKVAVAIMAVISRRFVEGEAAITSRQLSADYGLPVALVTPIVKCLHKIGLINFIDNGSRQTEHPLQPAVDVTRLTIGRVIRLMQYEGKSDFIPEFSQRFEAIDRFCDEVTDQMISAADITNITSLNINTLKQ